MPLMVENEQKFGFINRNGVEIVKIQYEDADNFSEGLAAVKFNGKWGFINIYGDLVISHKYTFTKPFTNDLAIVYFGNKKFGCIDRNGNVVIEPLYSKLIFSENKYIIAKLYEDKYTLGSYGLIDIKGNVIVPFRYDNYIHFYSDFAIIEKDKKFGAINKDGQIIIESNYDYIHYDRRGHFLLQTDKNWFLADKAGNKIKKLPSFEANGSIILPLIKSTGLNAYIFKENEKYGLIDNNYNIVLEPIYDNIGQFSEGWIPVVKDGKYFYIDRNGNRM